MREPAQETNGEGARLSEGDVRLRVLLRQLPGAVWTTDQDLCFTSMMGTAEAIMGLPQKALLGAPLATHFDGPAGERIVTSHMRALAGETVLYEVTWHGRFYQCRLEPLRGHDGRIRGAIGVAIDVTEQRRAEEMRLLDEERLRTLVEASPDPIFMKDGEGRWLEVNHAGLELFQLDGVEYHGLKESELAAHSDFYREALLHCERSDAAAWDAGRMSRDEEVVPRHDGTVRTYDVLKVPLFHADGRRKGLVVLGRDITERKQAEEERDRLLLKEQAARAAAERAERRAAFLAEASRLLAGSLDVGDTAVRLARLAVPFAADWCGVYTVDHENLVQLDALAHRDPDKERTPGLATLSLDPSLDDGVMRAIRHGEPVLRKGLAGQSARARLAALGASDERAAAIVDALGLSAYIAVPLTARGRTLGAMTFALGGGGERTFEAADVSLAEDLARRAALALSNAHLYQQAQEAIRARDEFLSIASHELRTPCTSLRLGVQSLLKHARKGSLDELPASFLERLLETSDRQTRHLAHLIDRLLDVSRIQAGQLELEVDEVDLGAVAREVVAELREEVGRAGSVIELFADEPVVGAWDRGRLRQVTVNLLSNALKYGEGKPVSVRAWTEGDTARLLVQDRGIGIEPTTQKRIFERFERAVSSRNYGGLGLGLYIVRQIVDAHGGAIVLESAPGEGSSFTVSLPRATPPAHHRRPPGTPPSP